ncbi:MAG: formate dehydrogenase subunit alpha [Phycisphaerales bacterium]|nr:formate dehydrogenase subunit alpha [Phycisphaerales bacterium]
MSASASTTSVRTATIDTCVVEPRPGETILAAARRSGVEIPTLCFKDGLEPEGGCRVCLVEIEGGRPQAACHTPLAPGMVVRTQSKRLDRLRHDVLSLMVGARPEGAFAPGDAGSRFETLLARYHVNGAGIAATGNGSTTAHLAVDDSHPIMRFDRDRCIACRLCLNACEQVQGQFVYGIEGRGAKARLIFGPNEQFADSGCVACGACVAVCPTGAITDRDRIDHRLATAQRDSVCGYCGVGCRVRIGSADEVVVRVDGVPDAAVNRGHLCVKGRYAHAFHHSADRLATPLLRDGDGFRSATWTEAIAYTAQRLTEIRDGHGPDALAVLTSSRSTNEAAYLLQKMFRSVVGTNNTDCCARICHSSTAMGLALATGTGAATASYDDIDEATCIVVAGANPTEAHPVVGARLKQAALRGAKLIVIDPRRIELAEYADVSLQLWPGTNVPLFNAMAKVLLDENLFDRAYLGERCEGLGELSTFLETLRLADLAAVCRVPEESIRAAARTIATSGPPLLVSGLGLSEQTQGVAAVMAYTNLGMLTGAIGRRGAGMLPLRGQNNVQGNADMGSQPNALTGYLRLDDGDVRDRLMALWGAVPSREPGLTIPEMFESAAAGTLRALWIQGEDVAQSDPHHELVMQALDRVEFLVVQELFMTGTAERADVVFPAASVFEQEGTFTNGERRVQHVVPVVPAPGEARPDWEVVRDVANAMGATWSYGSPSDVMDEIAQAAPSLFGGISYDRLGDDGIQWPCPTPDHPGTRTVHANGFVRGRGLLTAVDYIPSLDRLDEQHPFLLITGRILEHYNVGTMTRRTPAAKIVPADVLEMHPEDAGRLGIDDGAPVRLASHYGTIVVPARRSRRMLPGTVFLSFHFPETETNVLVGPHRDPRSNCPDYKVVAVGLAPA